MKYVYYTFFTKGKLMLYFTDVDNEVYFAISDEDEDITIKVINFLSNAYGKAFEEISDSWAEDYAFDKDTLIIEARFFNEDILEVVDFGVDIHII